MLKGAKKRSGFQLDEEMGEEESCQQFIPYEAQIDDNTIALSEGEYMQVVKLDGVPYVATSEDELNRLTDRFNLVLRAIADPRIIIWHNAIKKRVDVKLEKSHKSDYQEELFTKYQKGVDNQNLMIVEHYISIIVRNPNNLTLNLLEKVTLLFSKGVSEEDNFVRNNKLAELEKAISKIKSGMKGFNPVLLGVYRKGNVNISEVQSFLYRLINGHDREVKLSDKIIKRILPTSRPFFKKASGTLIHHIKGRKDFSSLSIKEYGCSETSSDAFRDLINLNFEYVFTQTFEFQTRDESIEELEKQHRTLSGSGDRGFTDIDDIHEAMDDVASRKSVFGLSTLNIIVFSDHTNDLKENMEEADAAISKASLMTIRDDVVLEAKWWSQLPGNFKYRTRVCRISSRNFVDFSSMHNDIIPSIGGEWWGEPLFIAKTDSLAPFPFDLHVGQRGNTTVIGETGSGKTVVMAMIALSISKYGGRFFYFDKDRGAEIAVRACGGSYMQIKPGYPTGFNPCQLEESPENINYLEKLIGSMVKEKGKDLPSSEKKIISAVVKANYEFSHDLRRLRYLEGLFPSGDNDDLKVRFSLWINDGAYAWLFDNKEDTLDLDSVGVGFDLTSILDDEEVRGEALSYMTHRIKLQVNGDPFAIIIDEGWKALSDELFEKDIKNWSKVIRKQEGVLIFGSNSARDLASSETGREIIDQSVTRLFGFNPKAKREDYKQGFSLTEEEFQTVKGLKERQFLFKKGEFSNIVTIPFDGLEDELTIVSGTEKSVLNMERIMSEFGEKPCDWINKLKKVSIR